MRAILAACCLATAFAFPPAARAEENPSVTSAPTALPPRNESQPPPLWTSDTAQAARELDTAWAFLTNVIAQSQPTASAPVVSARAVFRFALESTGFGDNGWHPERVEAALRFGRTLQDTDPNSKTRGGFKWLSNADRPRDANALEFVAQFCGALHRAHAQRLTPAAKKQLEEIMTTSLDGMERRDIRLDYTNITLIRAWNWISHGEALNRPAIAEKGYKHFDDWLRFTARAGITEFGAPTYYGINLDTLALIAKYAARPAARAKALAALRYLWTETAANWWAPGDRPGGANARTYDYTWGRGYIEAHAWTAGWLRAQPKLETDGWLPGGWIPSPRDNLVALRALTTLPPPGEWTRQLLAELPRTVVQRTGEDPAALATNWTSRAINLASSSLSRGGDDRALAANIGASPAVPQMMFFMDGRGDPYGVKKSTNADGISKALHLVPFIASVQRGPEVLQALSWTAPIPPAPKSGQPPARSPYSCLLSHLTIPAQAEVWAGDTQIPPGTPQHPAPVPPDAPVFIRLGDAALAMRILYANAAGSNTPAPIQFIRDPGDFPLNRLTIIHDASAPAPGARATAVIWLRAADNLDAAAFAKFRHDFAAAKASATLDDKNLKAWADGLAGKLRVEADISAKKPLVLEGGEPRPALLTVNGREVGAPILGEFLKE